MSDKEIVLQSNRVFNDLGVMDDYSGEITFYSKLENSEYNDLRLGGVYEIVEETFFALFRRNKVLYFRADSEEYLVSDEIVSKLTLRKGKHFFELIRDEKTFYEFEYSAPDLLIPLEDDPTPFIEYEDFDFLYFVHSIIGDRERQKRFCNDKGGQLVRNPQHK